MRVVSHEISLFLGDRRDCKYTHTHTADTKMSSSFLPFTETVFYFLISAPKNNSINFVAAIYSALFSILFF